MLRSVMHQSIELTISKFGEYGGEGVMLDYSSRYSVRPFSGTTVAFCGAVPSLGALSWGNCDQKGLVRLALSSAKREISSESTRHALMRNWTSCFTKPVAEVDCRHDLSRERIHKPIGPPPSPFSQRDVISGTSCQYVSSDLLTMLRVSKRDKKWRHDHYGVCRCGC